MMQQERLARAAAALEGLSTGDALGGFYEMLSPAHTSNIAKNRVLPSAPWHFTDDTNMALSIYSVLRQYGVINQDALALSFAQRFDASRGYGMSIRGLVGRILNGQHWREAAQLSFGGQGSFGNGGAMRVAPIGAYFADDLDTVVEQAHQSAEISHAHPEGIAGAVAVAVGAAFAWHARKDETLRTRPAFIAAILPYVPLSEVRTRVQQAGELSPGIIVPAAAEKLGNGSNISAQDTVAFTLWCAGEYLTHYEEAIWAGIAAGGDVDTTCAIIGGIVAAYTGVEGIPAEWRTRREPLPEWAFTE